MATTTRSHCRQTLSIVACVIMFHPHGFYEAADRTLSHNSSMNIDNTELLEALKLTQPPKPEKANDDGGVPKDRVEIAGGEG